MNAWTISDPPTEADHLKAAGLFDADLDRATRAIDKIEQCGVDRAVARRVIGKVAAGGMLTGVEVVDLHKAGFGIMRPLGGLPKWEGVEMVRAVASGRVSFADVLDAIEAAS